MKNGISSDIRSKASIKLLAFTVAVILQSCAAGIQDEPDTSAWATGAEQWGGAGVSQPTVFLENNSVQRDVGNISISAGESTTSSSNSLSVSSYPSDYYELKDATSKW